MPDITGITTKRYKGYDLNLPKKQSSKRGWLELFNFKKLINTDENLQRQIDNNRLTAGENIVLAGNVISAVDTVYDDSEVKELIRTETDARILADSFKEDKINKKIDFSVFDNNGYPTTLAVENRLQAMLSSFPKTLKVPKKLDLESSLPPLSELETSDCFMVQEMDETAPQHTGFIWINNDGTGGALVAHVVVDMYLHPDEISLELDGNGALTVNMDWLTEVIADAIAGKQDKLNRTISFIGGRATSYTDNGSSISNIKLQYEVKLSSLLDLSDGYIRLIPEKPETTGSQTKVKTGDWIRHKIIADVSAGAIGDMSAAGATCDIILICIDSGVISSDNITYTTPPKWHIIIDDYRITGMSGLNPRLVYKNFPNNYPPICIAVTSDDYKAPVIYCTQGGIPRRIVYVGSSFYNQPYQSSSAGTVIANGVYSETTYVNYDGGDNCLFSANVENSYVTAGLSGENRTKFTDDSIKKPFMDLLLDACAKINGLVTRTNDMRITIVSRYLGNLTSASNYFPLFAAVGHYANRYEIIVSGVYNGFVFYYVTNFTRNLDTVQDINLAGMTNSKMTINLHGALSLTIGGVDINAQNSLTVTVNRIS